MFVGVHLAWSEHSRTGLAAVDSAGDLVDLWSATSDADIVDWVEEVGEEGFLLGIDAPLILRHQAGSRPCEQALEMAFHQLHPTAYPANTHLRAFAGGVRPERLAAALGVDRTPGSTAPRRAIEVYPEPSVIPLFGLDDMLTFRRGATTERIAALNKLFDLIEGLSTQEVPMRVETCSGWEEMRTFVDAATTHDELHEAVDLVDAVMCAYVAMYVDRRPELTYTFGDADTGYIITPVTPEMRQALDTGAPDVPHATGAVTVETPTFPDGGREAAPVHLTQTTDTLPPAKLDEEQVMGMFGKLRRFQHDGTRAPHRALLVLTALGRLARNRSSVSPFVEIQPKLAELIGLFGPPSTTPLSIAAADTFTDLGRDGVWVLDADVAPARSEPLHTEVSGRFVPEIEAALRRSSRLCAQVARLMVDLNFPDTIAADVLAGAGLEPDVVRRVGDIGRTLPTQRRPRAGWAMDILNGWDRKCAFCGFDGTLGSMAVGLEPAHVRWFALDGPDDLDNGLALCSLHHKLFDSGVLGLDESHRVQVSPRFGGRSAAASAVRDLYGMELQPPSGAPLPAQVYIDWHRREVFKGEADPSDGAG
jgi:putative restriction endonuclease